MPLLPNAQGNLAMESPLRSSPCVKSILDLAKPMENCKQPLLLYRAGIFAKGFSTILHKFQYICSYLANIYLAISAVFLEGSSKGPGRVTELSALAEK